MSITRPTLTDSTSAITGDIVNAAFFTDLYDRIDALIGNWTAVPFNAANFTGSGSMTWTVASGDVLNNRYQVINKTLHWVVTLDQTTVVAPLDLGLRIALPTGTLVSTQQYARAAYIVDSGTFRDAIVQPVSTTQVQILLTSGSAWAAATNTTTVSFQAIFELA
jgi:hypothetical protein